MTKRLAAIDAQLADASALARLQLVQERMDLEKELASMGQKVDLTKLEGEFVKTAKSYSRAQGHLVRRLARARRVGRHPQEGRRLPLVRSDVLRGRF